MKKTEDLSQSVSILYLNFSASATISFKFLKLIFLFQSVSFRKTSRNLARVMFWKNVKLYFIVGGVALVSVILSSPPFFHQLQISGICFSLILFLFKFILQVIIYFIVSMSCGGLTWKNCV